MAIAATHHYIVRDLRDHGLLPKNGAILQLGEANWYGDLDPRALFEDIRKYVDGQDRQNALVKRLTEAVENPSDFSLFHVAEIFYEIFFSPCEMQAIDFHGTPTSHQFDLNCPVTLNRRFDVVINNGTAEHIFNIAQVFKTMHDYTVPGGLMIHESPFTGWIDHGFYSLQPTLFFDVAESNGYVICGMFVQDLTGQSILQIPSREAVYELAKSKRFAENTMMFTILIRAKDERPFRIPAQGYYGKGLSASGQEAWRSLR